MRRIRRSMGPINARKCSSARPSPPALSSSTQPALSLSGAGRQPRDPLWHRGRARRLRLVGHAEDLEKAGMAGLAAAAEMIERQPYLPRFMAGGPGNPLGRARFIWAGRSTVFTAPTQPETIGHAVSSGASVCVNRRHHRLVRSRSCGHESHHQTRGRTYDFP